MSKLLLEDSLSNAVVKLFRKVNRIHNNQLAILGLTAEQVHILSIIWDKGNMTIGALQHELSLSSGTMAGAIDRMEKKGLLERQKSDQDKRVTFIKIGKSVTKHGKKKINQILSKTEEDLFKNLSRKEQHQLLELLHKAYNQV